MKQYNNILLSISNDIATLTINRPDNLNALNTLTLREIYEVIQDINEEKIKVRVLLITGAGEKAFVAGADIKEMAHLNAIESRKFSKFGNEVFMAVQNLSIPTIAVINGYALGGGLELAMSCDIRLGSNKALVGLPEVGLGVIPGFGGTQRLPRIVGLAKANELLFTGGSIKALEALEIGLFNKVFEPEELMSQSLNFAKKIVSKAPMAVEFAKLAANKGIEMSLSDALNYETELFGLLFSTEDQKEGMKAFVEKRNATFQNK